MKNLLKTGALARVVTFAALPRLKACRKPLARLTALLLLAAILVDSLGRDVAAQERPNAALAGLSTNSKATLAIVGIAGAIAGVGVGVYVAVQQAHAVTGCVIDNPDGLLLQAKDGNTYVLLGNTTKIQANERIKVTGTRKKKINGITNQPSFIVEKLNKVYGGCSVTPTTP